MLPGRSPRAFADALEKAPRNDCDLVFSLERVWRCDCYRAGDGVHRAWLERRSCHEPAWRSWFRRINPKHRQILDLEASLFGGEAGLVIANSRLVAAEIRQHFDYPADRIRVVYNGVPPRAEEGKRVEIRARLGIGESECLLLFAGSGWERKGLRFAIEAVNRQTGSVRLVVAGRGDAAKMPVSDRTTYLGPVADMTPLLEAADVFILPTLYDPFSNACLEALAAGLPVITTAGNGFSEIIRPGKEGEVVASPDDISSLSRAIAEWSDPARAAGVRGQLKELGSKYSIDANLEATLEILLRTKQDLTGFTGLSAGN